MWTFSTITTGNQRSPASTRRASFGMRAILSWLSFSGLPLARAMRSAIEAFSSIGRPKACAMPSIVRSSWVGPIPPDVNTKS